MTTSEGVAHQIGQIQVAYLNDTNADAAIVSCIAELAHTRADAKDHERSMLAKMCADSDNKGEGLKDDLTKFISAELDIKAAQMQLQAETGKIKASVDHLMAQRAHAACDGRKPEEQVPCIIEVRKAFYETP